MTTAVNPYAAIDLFLPEKVHQRVDSLVSRGEADPKPFARQVDLWWAGIGRGVKSGVRTPMSEKSVKFNTGVIFNSDPWRITHLELLALSAGGEEVLESPGQVVRIASEFANTGLMWIIDALLGEAEPTLTFMNQIVDGI
jgi:hypothetical protein